MKILYFGTICNMSNYDALLASSNKRPSVASIAFESALLEGFYKNGVDIDIYCFPMIPHFFTSKIIGWGNKKETLNCGYHCTWLKTLNIPFFKQITRRINGRKIIKKWLKENANEKCTVITYSIPPFLAKDVIKISRKYKTQTCAIVPDLIRDMYKNSNYSHLNAWIRKKYLENTQKIQGEYDKYIYFTKYMAEEINPLKPYIVIEGILNLTLDPIITHIEKSDPRAIMYAGRLHKKYGILNLVDGYEQANLYNTELWLFGNGNATEEIKKRAECNSSIRLFGVKSREEVLEYERKASLLVNPRGVEEEFTKYSFPSKTIEYMSSGTPMLTTKLKGIPEEYFQYVFSVENNEVDTLATELSRIMAIPNTKLQEEGIRARQFVIEQKSAVVQAKRIIDFLGELSDKDNTV